MEPRWEMILTFEDRDDWFTIIFLYSSPFLLFNQKADISTIVDRLTDTSKYGGTHKVAESLIRKKNAQLAFLPLELWFPLSIIKRRGSTQAEKEKEKRDELTQRYWLLSKFFNNLFSGVPSEFFNTQDVMICYYHLNSKTKQTILIFAHWTVTIPPSLTVMWLGTSTRAPMPSQDDCSSPSPDDRSLQLEEEDGSDAPRVKLRMASFVPFHEYFRLCDTSALVHSVPAYVSHGPAFLVK